MRSQIFEFWWVAVIVGQRLDFFSLYYHDWILCFEIGPEPSGCTRSYISYSFFGEHRKTEGVRNA
jgi:hypothetical protein